MKIVHEIRLMLHERSVMDVISFVKREMRAFDKNLTKDLDVDYVEKAKQIRVSGRTGNGDAQSAIDKILDRAEKKFKLKKSGVTLGMALKDYR